MTDHREVSRGGHQPPPGGAAPGAVAPVEVVPGELVSGEVVPGDVAPGAGAGRHRALVITASNRAAAGVYADRGGPLLADGLRNWGFAVDGPLVVPDGEPVAEALRDAVREQYDVVLTTGGTGLSPTDRTPEATSAVLDREIPGLAEAIRSRGTSAGIVTAALSRGLAGLAGQTLIVNLPGSPGGCRDGLAVLDGVLLHAVDQIHGGDHAASGTSPSSAVPSLPPEPLHGG